MKKCPYCGAEFIPKAQGLSTGLLPEEATEKAILQTIEKYPFLSKVKRQELGLGKRKPKKEGG